MGFAVLVFADVHGSVRLALFYCVQLCSVGGLGGLGGHTLCSRQSISVSLDHDYLAMCVHTRWVSGSNVSTCIPDHPRFYSAQLLLLVLGLGLGLGDG